MRTAQELAHRVTLALAPDERRRLQRQVRRTGVEALQGSEVGREVLAAELEDLLWLGQVLQTVPAEIAQLQVGRQLGARELRAGP